jgi:hypothetical protein
VSASPHQRTRSEDGGRAPIAVEALARQPRLSERSVADGASGEAATDRNSRLHHAAPRRRRGGSLLRRDCPSTRVAVQSSDPDGLKERAAGLGLAVFDKLDVESLLAWVERQAGVWNGLGSTTVAALAPRRDVSCSQCGYGVVSREPPKRCRCATTALRGKLLYPRRRTGASADSANARRYVTPQTVRRPRESCRRCRGRGRHGVREGQRDGQ